MKIVLRLIFILLLASFPLASFAKPVFIIKPNVSTLNLGPHGSGAVNFTITNNAGTNFSNNLSYTLNSTPSNAFKVSRNPLSTCGPSLLKGTSCSLMVNVKATTSFASQAPLTPEVCYFNHTCTLAESVPVTIARQVRFAYIVNNNNVSTVSVCPVHSDGTLGSCTVSNGSNTFNVPIGIAINAAGTLAYVVNLNNNTVSVCSIHPDGSFGACEATSDPTFNVPAAIVLNPAGTFAYIPNNIPSGTVSFCPINPDGTLGTCTASSPVFSAPAGITINTAGTFAYVVNNSGSVASCPINANGTFGACTTSDPGGTFSNSVGIALNAAGTLAYVVNFDTNNVSLCTINPNGTLNSCSTLNPGGAFNGPTGVTINTAGTLAYVANNNLNINTISLCPINPDGTLNTCKVLSDPTFSGPYDIALF